MSVIVIFLFFRVVYLFTLPVPLEALTLFRGVLSDILVGALVYYILVKPLKVKVQIAVHFVLVVFLTFNLEHLRVNGAHIDFSFWQYAIAPEFALGSILSSSLIGWVLVMCLVCYGLIISTTKLTQLAHKNNFKLSGKPIIFISLVGILGLLLFPAHARISWQGTNPIEYNALSSFNSLFTPLKTDAFYNTIHPQDLSGDKYIQSLPQANILMVMVESLSYKHIQEGLMPKLKQLADKNLSFSKFITNQRQTNRGLYSSLCGRYPNLNNSAVKSDFYLVDKPNFDCLPQILKNNGYKTVFMQSAGLAFISKDRFGRNIGFDEIIGEDDYDTFFFKTSWGVDDKTLYHHATNKIAKLNEKNEPWFAAILTSGTHHPFLVPEGKGSFQEALAYADLSLAYLIEELEKQNILENTLVLITSDEANASGTGFVSNPLWDNWAPMVVLSPKNNESLIEPGVFTLADLPISILDYAEIEAPISLGGRSLFRKYSEKRPVFFGNVYTKTTFSLVDNSLTMCNSFLYCWQMVSPQSLFDEDVLTLMPATVDRISTITKIVSINDQIQPNRTGDVLLNLSQNDFVGKSDYPLLGQYRTNLPAGRSIRYELIVDNSLSQSASEVSVNIKYHPCHNYTPGATKEETKIVRPGQVLTWNNIVTESLDDNNLCHFITAKTTKNNNWQLSKLALIVN